MVKEVEIIEPVEEAIEEVEIIEPAEEAIIVEKNLNLNLNLKSS